MASTLNVNSKRSIRRRFIVEKNLRNINELPIRADQKEGLIVEFNRRKRDKTLKRFKEILDLPWGIFCEANQDVGKAKSILSEKRDYVNRATQSVLETTAAYAILQRENQSATFPYILLFRSDGSLDKQTLKFVTILLGRPVETVCFDGATTREDIIGSTGSMGRVMEAVKRAKCCNPVIVLEGMKRITTPKVREMVEQLGEHRRSHSFVDEFVGVPFDLSNVIFIYLMDLRDFVSESFSFFDLVIASNSEMTTENKIVFIKENVLPPILAAHRLEGREFLFDDHFLRSVVDGYRIKAKFNQYGRLLGTIAANLQRRPAIKDRWSVLKENCTTWKWDGRLEFSSNGQLPVGCATTVGVYGQFEKAAIMPISSKFSYKNQIINENSSDKEMIHIAYKYCRSNAERYRIPADKIEKKFTVTFPNGRGLSRGCATFLSVYSLFTDRHVRNDSVTSGIVTLSGRILQIGGVYLKSYAAYKSGVRRMVLPEGNRISVEREISGKLKEEMKFVFVETVDELIEAMMEQLTNTTKTTTTTKATNTTTKKIQGHRLAID